MIGTAWTRVVVVAAFLSLLLAMGEGCSGQGREARGSRKRATPPPMETFEEGVAEAEMERAWLADGGDEAELDMDRLFVDRSAIEDEPEPPADDGDAVEDEPELPADDGDAVEDEHELPADDGDAVEDELELPVDDDDAVEDELELPVEDEAKEDWTAKEPMDLD